MRIDLHQHLWPAPFVAALRDRRTPPRLDGWLLEVAGARPYDVDPTAHDPAARAQLAAATGEDVVCLSPAVSLGTDRLPPAEADRLADAWLEGALALPAPFCTWAAARTPRALEDALAAGAIGWEVAADRLAARDGLDDVAAMLDLLAGAGRPLFVHPGPAGDMAGRPDWWTPVVPY